MKKFDGLKLNNQLCFPLYVCSKEIVRKYKPYLDEIDLTYTQYITMMVLWEHEKINVKEIGKLLYLDSGTLTPLLKKLEERGYIERKKSTVDERNLDIIITQKGKDLRKEAILIPSKMANCANLTSKEAAQLYMLLKKIMHNLDK